MATINILLSILMVTLLYPCGEAKLLAMRPLSGAEVYRLLHESGRSDAIPQGRVITQGLAAMTGFALGLTKGLGGAFLFDVITANVTGLDLAGAGNSGSSQTAYTTQEVCFNSRNARSLDEAEAVVEAYSRDDGKKRKNLNVRKSDGKRLLKRKRRNKRGKRPSRLTLAKQAGTATDGGTDAGTVTDTGAGTATGTQTANPTTTATTAESPSEETNGTGTNIDNGTGSGTSSVSTTSTGNDGAINCVVIQKPTVG